jgi:hypothetical protein
MKWSGRKSNHAAPGWAPLISIVRCHAEPAWRTIDLRMTIRINGVVADAKKWPKMPERGQDDPVPILLNGVRGEAQVTRGGTPPKTYSYFRIGAQVYYVLGHIPHNAEVTHDI